MSLNQNVMSTTSAFIVIFFVKNSESQSHVMSPSHVMSLKVM
jgi:hypothetical protein